MKYNKLVGDRIPGRLRKQGEPFTFHVANDEELWLKLKEKLLEEAREFLEAKPEKELEELADVSEVIDWIMRFGKFSESKLNRAKDKKRQERGGFRDRIILDEAWGTRLKASF